MTGFRMLVPDLLQGDYERFDWQPFRPGVQLARLYRDGEDGPEAALLRYAPGASVPAHVHRGFEHILVLEGCQEDERGRYARGSLLIHGPDTGHRVASAEGCIVLAIWGRPVKILEEGGT
jgi:predicted ChrR family anti-sigma factor